jgi:hypothetical protein
VFREWNDGPRALVRAEQHGGLPYDDAPHVAGAFEPANGGIADTIG